MEYDIYARGNSQQNLQPIFSQSSSFSFILLLNSLEFGYLVSGRMLMKDKHI